VDELYAILIAFIIAGVLTHLEAGDGGKEQTIRPPIAALTNESHEEPHSWTPPNACNKKS
jgi:hypothetical protein